MKEIFFIKDSAEHKITYFHLLFFLLSLPFDRFYSTIILLSLVIHTLIFFRRQQIQQIGRTTFILQSVFIVTVISLSYAISFSAGLDIAEKQSAIFLFPVLFALTTLDIERYRSRLLGAFAAGCTATIIYLFIDAFRVIAYNKLPVKDIFSPAFVNHNFSLPIEMHATYLSMLLAIAFIYLLNRLLLPQKAKIKLLFVAGAAVLLAGLIQLGSKSVLIALLAIINIGFPFLVVKKKKRGLFIIISVAVSALVLLSVLSVDVFRERYVVLLKTDLNENAVVAEQYGRLDRWNVAVELIKRHPVIGTGAGSETGLLREMYFDRKMYDAYLNSLNAHNQYLGFLINSGIIGLVVWLATLFWGFWQSIKRRDILLFGFITLVTVVCFSEDILTVNKGIFFYAFFFSFLTVWKKRQSGTIPPQGNLRGKQTFI